MPSLLSVNVGMPKDVPWQGRTVFTGVWKYPVHGPVMARQLNLDGDGQGDRAGHGGEQRAVLVYQTDSYRHWQHHLGRENLEHGQFGENFTVDGLADDEVCIGDRYRIGEAEFEVTQPRVTCYRVGLRMGEPSLPALLVSHRRPGFYMRVLREGHVQAGDDIVKISTGPGALTVADTDALLYLPDRDIGKLRRAVRIPAMSPGWLGSFRELLEAAERGSGPTDSTSATPAWKGFRPLKVTTVQQETPTVSSIELAAPDGSDLPPAHGGQHLTLRLPAVGDPPPVRSYSLSSAPRGGRYRISVKHEPHGVASAYLTTGLRPGTMIDVAAPRGDFVLEPGAGPVLLISAGIGLTPVLAMLHELAAARSRREIWWIHSARNAQEHALAAEAHALISSLPQAQEHIFYSEAPSDQVSPSGVIHHRLSKDAVNALGVPRDATAYVCGPDAFMSDVKNALAAAGVSTSAIHTELFGALGAITPGLRHQSGRPPHQPAGAPGTGPMVTFARSGISTPFPDSGGSLLELAEACDVPVRWSCRTGVCHTCVTAQLAGDISYRPMPLEPPSRGEALICCARPDSDVVLDL
ncbi:MOSC and FAD-binding oxidoreductase domain-containing protein [Streptomyces sp. NPDC048224]|uniref:MOSC and FAD-binding oxidoreductase domain-containing protein n=1 Tax=Streptomyces sp. NPDC048224 TaxID=3154500 RepID=UPI0033FE9578